MTRLSINEMTTFRWSFEEDVREYRAASISAMGVWRRKLSDYGEQRDIELLRQSGLAVSNLLWAGGFIGSEGHSYRESIDDAPWIGSRKALGAAIIESNRLKANLALRHDE